MSTPNGLMRPRSLDSKSRSFLPSTKPPRQDEPPTKKFRSSAAPKGTKLASGYVDRAAERHNTVTDDKHARLKRLEEMLKLEQIDEATFLQQKDELGIGGDAETTHLVKGLDFKLLERVRRGEDVLSAPKHDEDEPAADVQDEDVEDELERALERDVVASTKHPVEEAEQPAVRLSRDELLRRMKHDRHLLTEPSLDQSRFKKLESAPKPGKKKFTETVNGRRREVLVITGKDGTQKRKTRWIDPEPVATETWGGDLPEEVVARQKAAVEQAQARADEDDDADIFGGVAEYDPLAGLGSDAEDEAEADVAKERADDQTEIEKRNYFGETQKVDDSAKSGHDPSILAALKRAAQLRRQEEDGDDDTKEPADSSGDRSAALLRRLQKQSRQDDQDLDMGFDGRDGYGDEDEADSKQKLSEWKGVGQDDEDDDDGGGKGAGSKRKRGGKKKKGDKNNFADVMSVIEGRKKT